MARFAVVRRAVARFAVVRFAVVRFAVARLAAGAVFPVRRVSVFRVELAFLAGAFFREADGLRAVLVVARVLLRAAFFADAGRFFSAPRLAVARTFLADRALLIFRRAPRLPVAITATEGVSPGGLAVGVVISAMFCCSASCVGRGVSMDMQCSSLESGSKPGHGGVRIQALDERSELHSTNA